MKARFVSEIQKTYNLELWKKLDGKWRHSETVLWNSPYAICSGEKKKREAYKAHFEFYKIIPNR